MLFRVFILSGMFFILWTCGETSTGKKSAKIPLLEVKEFNKKGKSALEISLIKQGLVDIQKIIPDIQIDVRYATVHNFTGVNLYGKYNKVYLQPDVAQKLAHAQRYLKQIDSGYSLLVFDGTRPKHIQQLMWDTLKLPLAEKTKFLSNPKNHSIHNYGAAVDVTISKNGKEIDMGTPYDFIGKLAYPRLENHFLATGKLTHQHLENRKHLKIAMQKAGFTQLPTEWWHFNNCTRTQAKEKYQLIP